MPEAGYEVAGLDSSPDMLGPLADRPAEPERRRYAGKLETVQGT